MGTLFWTGTRLLLLTVITLSAFELNSHMGLQTLDVGECNPFFGRPEQRGSRGCGAIHSRSVLVIRDKLYGAWSNWSDCSPATCSEHRLRRCLDDSFMEPSAPRVLPTVCSFKYLVEERPCANPSECADNAEPSEELKRMNDICGFRSVGDTKNRTVYSNAFSADLVNATSNSDAPYVGHNDSSVNRYGSWPWNVRIYRTAARNRSRMLGPKMVCGGTLLTPHWVLTAAHCLRSFFWDHQVPFGEPTNVSNMVVGVGGDNKQHPAALVLIHPEWDAWKPNSHLDVALIKLRDPVDLEIGTAAVACLPQKNNSVSEGATCYSVGWEKNRSVRRFGGRRAGSLFSDWGWQWAVREVVTEEERPDMPRVLNLTIEPPQKCFLRVEEEEEGEEEEYRICAQSDECAGGTGGGLFCRNDQDGRWYVHGVLGSSTSNTCSPRRRLLFNSFEGISKWIYHQVE